MRHDVNRLTLLIMIAIVAFAGNAFAASLNAQPGLWKIKTTAGGLRVPITRCIIAADIADRTRVAKAFGHPFNLMGSRRPNTPTQGAKQTCNFSEPSQASDSFSYKEECHGQFSATEEGSAKFDTPTHYLGDFTFAGDSDLDVQPGSREIKTDGTRIGDCTVSTVDSSNNPLAGQSTH
jgi:hypothetical protein